jgi:pimeloyl-ACP methyl ester carboxylesterase
MSTHTLTSPRTVDDTVRPFRVDVADEAIVELQRRAAATRWPDHETVPDRSQGAKLADLHALVDHWARDYSWRTFEAKLNALPQFMTNIDGLDIHFIHVRSRHENALPLIMTHGWPGSIVEFMAVIGPLTEPTAYGGRAEDAFDLVLPSLPGFGFSEHPAAAGWGPDHVARAWAQLMARLGYDGYVAQGGDWGSVVSEAMGRHAPAGLRAIHLNLPATMPLEIGPALASGKPPEGLTDTERATFDSLLAGRKTGATEYFSMLAARPQAMGYAQTDSPAGLAAWLLVHPGFDRWSYGADAAQSPTRDDVLDNFSLYWLTNSATSAARIYWEAGPTPIIVAAAQRTSEISVPVAITVFPDDFYVTPETWARRAFKNLYYFNEVDRGGHFAAWEQPQLFSEEMRAAFASLR